MFEQHFHLKENPFAAGHQPRFVYPSREHQEAIAHLRYGVENHEPFVLITGEVGTGKTTAVFNALNQLTQRASVALITNSALNRVELLEEICLRFGMQLEGSLSKPQLLAQLERHLQAVHARGDRSVLIVDEAQNLSRDLLEEIRLLSNLESQGDSMLQIFLVGQPELSTRLLQPELRQLRQRITVRYRLRPLDGEETEHYIHHRISVAGGNAWQIFPSISCRVVYDLTGGVPREINTVASQALLNAFVEDAEHVEPRHVQSVASEMGFESVVGVQEKTDVPDDTAVPAEEERAAESVKSPPMEIPPHEEEAEAPDVTTDEYGAEDEPASADSDDGWEPPVAEKADESSTSYSDLGIDEIYAEVETIDPAVQAPAADAAPRSDLGIEEMGADLPTEHTRPPAAREPERSTAEPPPPPPASAVSRALPSLEADDEVPWVEPNLGAAKPRAKPDVLAALRTELVQKYDAEQSAPTAPAETAATMLANLEHLSKPGEAESIVSTSDYVPARLRARLEAMERESTRPRRKFDGYAIAWIALIGVAIVVAVIVWSRLRHVPAPRTQTGAEMVEPTPAEQPAVAAAPSKETAPSTGVSGSAEAAPPGSKATATPGPSGHTETPTRVATTTSKPSAPTASAGAAEPRRPRQTFGVQVAVFLTQEKATEEMARLSRLAGRSGRVLHTDGDTWFRVVIGEFSTTDSASRAGNDIVQHGWVDDYTVVPITPATAAVAPSR